MTLYSTEIKRILNKKSFIIIFIMFTIFSCFALLQFKDSMKVDYSAELAIVDLDNSQKSTEFIAKLKENPALHIVENVNMSKNDIESMIKKSDINCGIIIPKDFFKNLPNSQIKIIYSELDVLAPALMDIISQDFVNDVCEKTMVDEVEKKYSKKDAENAIVEFEKLKNDNSFALEVIKEPFNSFSGIDKKTSMDEINSIKTIFMYVIVFNLLFVGLSLLMFRGETRHLISRMQVANKANKVYFACSTIVFLFIFAFNPFIICLLSAILLDMKLSAFLYLLFASLTSSVFVYELCGLFASLIKDENIVFSLNVVLIIFLSLMGGAFFSLDIMPITIQKIASFTNPLYMLSEAFYEAMNGESSIRNFLFLLLLYQNLLIVNSRKFTIKR